MKYLQRAVLKIVPTVILFILTVFLSANAQVSSFRLRTADSLFKAKLYTQSLDHYEEILSQNQYTPSMLLKMAFIQEGLNNTGRAMYYLNLYFLASNDEAALQKMEELAEKYNLEGYETGDADKLLVYYHDHYNYISSTLAGLVVLGLSLVFYTKVKRKKRPVLSTALVLIFVMAFFVHLNFGSRVSTGILAGNANYIMDGPSAGASLIVVAGGGHKVEVVGRKDVWLKIRWNDHAAYIRDNSVLKIEL